MVPPSHADVHGLFVGISHYQEFEDLPYCAADAGNVARLFQKLDGPLHIKASSSVVITDTNATLRAVVAALERFRDRLGEDDIFLFYFSGHGSGEGERDQTLVMFDSEGAPKDELSSKRLGALLASFPSRNLVMIDACFSGGFVGNLAAPRTLVLAGTSRNQESSLSYVHRSSGAFTHALIEGLAGEADATGDSRIEAGELKAYLSEAVPRYCSECGRRNPANRVRCFHDGILLSKEGARPQFGGAIDVPYLVLADAAWRPEHCEPGDESDCPKNCACAVKGECGMPLCISAGTKVLDACRSPDDRAACRENSAMCPCPEFGNCGMSECASQPGRCDSAEDRDACEKNADECPCGLYGECGMARCLEEK